MRLILQSGMRLWCERSTPEPLSVSRLATTCSAGERQPNRLISMGRNVVQECLKKNKTFPLTLPNTVACPVQSRVQVTVTNRTAPGRQSASRRGGTGKRTVPEPPSRRTSAYFDCQATTHVRESACFYSTPNPRFRVTCRRMVLGANSFATNRNPHFGAQRRRKLYSGQLRYSAAVPPTGAAQRCSVRPEEIPGREGRL